ncbi:coiled-coil domain-containing protein 167 isoform X1 [Pongo abelii]|uniref:coiled-coil domain-containing protein 167 isoform X1 n=1 Tax=Pongo abelii TaxID=9601 RepID=UPI00300562B6
MTKKKRENLGVALEGILLEVAGEVQGHSLLQAYYHCSSLRGAGRAEAPSVAEDGLRSGAGCAQGSGEPPTFLRQGLGAGEWTVNKYLLNWLDWQEEALNLPS